MDPRQRFLWIALLTGTANLGGAVWAAVGLPGAVELHRHDQYWGLPSPALLLVVGAIAIGGSAVVTSRLKTNGAALTLGWWHLAATSLLAVSILWTGYAIHRRQTVPTPNAIHVMSDGPGQDGMEVALTFLSASPSVLAVVQLIFVVASIVARRPGRTVSSS